MSHRHNKHDPKTPANRPARHMKPAPSYRAPKHAASDWRLRKVLRALANGARLTFDRVKGKWYCLGHQVKIHLKRNLMLELLKCKFVNFKLLLTSWGRYAAQAAL